MQRTTILALTLAVLTAPVNGQAAAACTAPSRATPFAPELSESRRMYRAMLTADGNTLYFFKRVAPSGERYRVFRSQKSGAMWSPAELVVIGDDGHSDLYPFVSRDGSRIVFSSYRPLPGADSVHRNAHLWTAERRGNDWGTPVPVSAANHPGHYHPGPVFTSDGSIRFTRLNPSYSNPTPLVSAFRDGAYQAPTAPSDPGWRFRRGDTSFFGGVLTASGDTAVIGFAVFDSVRRALAPSGVLYSIRRNGEWSAPRPIGGGINTDADENFLSITHDGCALVFTRDYTSLHIVSLRAAIGDTTGR